MAVQREFNWPINPLTVNSGPIQYDVNGAATTVNIDTVTPANSTPLPVIQYGPNGLPIELKSKAIDPVSLAVSSGSPIDTTAYVQFIASTAAAVYELEIQNTTGKTLYLAFGAAASEVNQIIVPTSGIERQSLYIPAGTRLSLKAVNSNATLGEVNANFFA
jgi:hypothetical protein